VEIDYTRLKNTMKTSNKYNVVFLLQMLLGLPAVGLMGYWMVASSVFMWRNPMANEFTIWREIPAVLKMQKLPEYQPDRGETGR
jgi:hypothetical protein